MEFNSLGMRDVEHLQVKGPGVFGILRAWGSFMEALQVPLEESFPRLLEQRLRTVTARPIEVMSCAVSGWGTDDQLGVSHPIRGDVLAGPHSDCDDAPQ